MSNVTMRTATMDREGKNAHKKAKREEHFVAYADKIHAITRERGIWASRSSKTMSATIDRGIGLPYATLEKKRGLYLR
jgi:hypothetical protein